MATTLKTILAEARAVVPEEGPLDVQRRLASGAQTVLIDVRDPDEYRDGYIEPATNVSRGFLEFRVGSVVGDSATPIVLYCQTGLRSMLAAKAVKDLGYGNVVNLQGGYQKWVQSGLPVVKDLPLGTDQIQRYSRHFLLSQVGEKGQRKLLRSKVLLIGAGGLGSPTALYLAAAGVGTIGLMDADVVDITNLQRQVLHTTADVGKPKVESAARTLKALNPDVNVIALPTRLNVDNAMDVIADYDVVIDGSDNFSTRYLVNDACFLAGKPHVHGSIFQFEGMASVFAPNHGPCSGRRPGLRSSAGRAERVRRRVSGRTRHLLAGDERRDSRGHESSAFWMIARTSGAVGVVEGSKRATTEPVRSTTNLAKFHLMSPGPSGLVDWLVSQE